MSAVFPFSVSVVIPTRNRPAHLRKLLNSLDKQILHPEEVIVVDSSDTHIAIAPGDFPRLSIRIHRSIPSVCVQRNIGVRIAVSPYVLLCDDDVVLPANYLSTIEAFVKDHAECNVVTGLWNDVPQIPGVGTQRSLVGLLWSFVFQTSVWMDLGTTQSSIPFSPVLHLLKVYYRKRGNSVSRAGWPIVTQFGPGWFRATVFTLGSAVVRRDWLLEAPYDEILEPHGIGDHYGVAMRFPQDQPIHVISGLLVEHSSAPENRPTLIKAYSSRLLALHYFLSSNRRFSASNRLWFVWSLVGNAVYFSVKRKNDFLKATVKVFLLIMSRRNPYVLASGQNQGVVREHTPSHIASKQQE
ncbi:MAG TPA: glycosyltransferase family A protein [Bacteroidota bacterium]